MDEKKEHKVGIRMGELLFETNDLGLAAYLKLMGMEIKKMFKQKGKTVFSFVNKPERKELVDKYFSGEGKVSPLAYKNALRDLKVYTINQ